MDKMTFASYKFKPSDVIEGLNRYFAETKANRYRMVPLEIRSGVCYNNPDCVKDIIFTNSPPERATRSGWRCWNHYIICDPEEVVGVAINWLREEHDIFYTPGMEAPGETILTPEMKALVADCNADEVFKSYEKRTLSDRIEELQESRRDYIAELQKNLHDAKRRIVALEAGHAEKTKFINHQATRIKDLEKSNSEKDIRIEWLEADIDITNRLVKEQREFITKVAELLETRDPYIEREYTATINALSNIVRHPNRYKWLYENLKSGMESVLQEAEERED